MARRNLLPMSIAPVSTVRDVAAAYLRHSRAVELHGPQGFAERERVLGLFSAHCPHPGVLMGDLPVDQCKAYQLSDWIESHQDWARPSTRKAKANIVKAAFQWAADGDRIAKNPFSNVRYGESERRPDMPEHIIELIATLGNREFERAVRFLRFTGCRVSELSNALWRDIDFSGKWTMPDDKGRKHRKKDKIVALVPEAIEIIQTIRRGVMVMTNKEPIGTDHVFLNCDGNPWKAGALAQYFDRIKERHKINTRASLHGIRHKFGTAAIAAGAPIKLVAQQLGHSSVVMTERYYCDLTNEIDAIRAAVQLGLPKK